MKNLFVLVACCFIFGCASTQNKPLDLSSSANLKGKSLTLVQRKSPNFVAMTSNKGMFAVAGVGAAVVAGNKLVKENQIADPAGPISESLAQVLTNKHGLVSQTGKPVVTDSDNLRDLVELANGGDYILDVATKGWSYMYDGFNFSDYYVGYFTNVRLIDAASSTVISSGNCAYDAKKAGKSPVTHEQLVKDDASYIKQELADAAEICVQQIASSLF